MKPKIPTERQIQVAFFDHVKIIEQTNPLWQLIASYPLQRGNDVVWLMMRLREGARKNHPDLHWPIKRGGYSSLYVEVKRKGNKIKDEQADYLEKLRKQGHHAICMTVDNHGPILDYFKAYEKGLIIK
jgi:hypothetical protein